MSSIIRFPEASSIAIHSMVLLARNRNGVVTQREIVKIFRISENHLAKVMLQLRRQGLITSVRGPSGGFLLARPPEEISLLEVHEAMVGKEQIRHCLFAKPACADGANHCPLGQYVRKLDSELMEFLSRHTLADVAAIVEVPDPRA